MSNPGVIKLIQKEIGGHNLWLDDNIGESIHIHYDQFRVDLTIDEFLLLCDELRHAIYSIVPFDLSGVDDRSLGSRGGTLLEIESIDIVECYLSDLNVYDDEGICKLPECNRVRALKREVDIDSTKKRKTNYYLQSNSNRLMSCLDYVKKNGYPVNGNYIWVRSNDGIIIDGWHRAACLYYLEGDLKIPVKIIKFKRKKENDNHLIDMIEKGSRIVLYGAGRNSIKMYNKIVERKCKLVAWCDKAAEKIQYKNDQLIISPDIIPKLEYDYILITVVDKKIIYEIMHELFRYGVDYKKIISLHEL